MIDGVELRRCWCVPKNMMFGGVPCEWPNCLAAAKPDPNEVAVRLETIASLPVSKAERDALYEDIARLRATAVDEACADGPFDPTYEGPQVDLVERPGQTKIPVWVTPLQACGLAAGPDREVAREALAALTQWLEEPA